MNAQHLLQMFMRIEYMVLGQLGMVQRRLQSTRLMVPARFLVALVSMEQLFGCALIVLTDMLCKRILNELVFMCHIHSLFDLFKPFVPSNQTMLLHVALQ